MERLLKITNALLGIIALCLVLLVVSVHRIDPVPTAHAQIDTHSNQPVYLVYQNASGQVLPIVGKDGRVPTK